VVFVLVVLVVPVVLVVVVVVFLKKNGLPSFLATIVNLPNNAWVQNDLDNFWHNSEPIH
jgi:hypothetical protein